MCKILIFLFLISLGLSIILGLIFIPIFKKIKFRQNILSYVEEHKHKNGTATMGGLFFISVALIICVLFVKGENSLTKFSLSICFAYTLVGFLDDFIKIKYKRNLGLRPYQKIIFQVSIAVVCSLYAYRNGLTLLFIPFTKFKINVGAWIIPLVIVVFLATTNTVNLTDGLDGLAGSVSCIYLLFTSLIVALQISNNSQIYLIDTEYYNLIKVSVIFAGAILGFLLFNTYKASVFMGDTGSLGLGGIIASISILTGNMLFILFLGICFVLSGLSVIIQVIYFKITKGKRIFLMAPLHHHFQHKGYSESKIVFAYCLLTTIMGLICICVYL